MRPSFLFGNDGPLSGCILALTFSRNSTVLSNAVIPAGPGIRRCLRDVLSKHVSPDFVVLSGLASSVDLNSLVGHRDSATATGSVRTLPVLVYKCSDSAGRKLPRLSCVGVTLESALYMPDLWAPAPKGAWLSCLEGCVKPGHG